MAYKIGNTTGNWSTAGTWNSVTNTPSLHASTNITITSSNFFSATFTAPNTTNACVGVMLYGISVGTGTLNVTLQESTVDTAATVAVTTANLTSNTWTFFKFPTPYVFTTTGAGAYRFKITNTGAGGSTTFAADSGGSNFAYFAVDDRTGVPASTDDVWIVGNNAANSITVTVDSTQTVGSGASTSLVSQRTLTNGVNIGSQGTLMWDTAATSTLNCKGNYAVYGAGTWQMGTTGSPQPTATTASLIFTPTSTCDFGIGLYTNCIVSLQGDPKSSTSLWKTTYSSGVGTAASPLITADAVDWDVGDEIVVAATGTGGTNYDETEYRFIITKNSSTSYVLSSTSGGSENALTYSHTTSAYILNVQRNVIVKTNNNALGFYLVNNATSSTIDMDWVRWENVGGNVSNKNGLYLSNASLAVIACDYSVIYRSLFAAWIHTSSALAITHTGLIATNTTGGGATQAGFLISGTPNKTLNDCFVLKTNNSGFRLGSANITLNNCVGISCNTGGGSVDAAFNLNGVVATTLNDCETHASRRGIVTTGANIADIIFNNFLSGTKGTTQTADIAVGAIYNTITFNNSTFTASTFVSGYTSMLAGSSVGFQSLNGTSTNHIWYTNYGTARSTGSGLSDTTIRTSGSLGVRIAPEDATTGFSWMFNIPAKALSIVSFFGYFQKNAAFGTSVAKVELFLPGNDPISGTADASQTLTNTTGSWQSVSISATNTQSIDALATIKVTGITATSAAYLYADDFYNSGDAASTTTDKVTGLDTWDSGKPVPILTPQAVNAADIWTFSTTGLTTANTTGKQVKDLLTVVKFLGLK